MQNILQVLLANRGWPLWHARKRELITNTCTSTYYLFCCISQNIPCTCSTFSLSRFWLTFIFCVTHSNSAGPPGPPGPPGPVAPSDTRFHQFYDEQPFGGHHPPNPQRPGAITFQSTEAMTKVTGTIPSAIPPCPINPYAYNIMRFSVVRPHHRCPCRVRSARWHTSLTRRRCWCASTRDGSTLR